MKYLYFFLIVFLFTGTVFSQTFITIDNDTHEFVEDVNYSLYSKKTKVFSAVTLNDKPTVIKQDIVYDSIVFSRLDYEIIGFPKAALDSVVFVTKKVFYLDEVVIRNKKDKEIMLGETNRFIKRRSMPFEKELTNGSVFTNGSPYDLHLDKIALYVEKVKYKTAYKINFTRVNEIYVDQDHVFAEPGEVIYTTDTLYLNHTDKGRIEVALRDGFSFNAAQKMFVWVQLLDYYDEAGNVINAVINKPTKLKFQLSKKTNYYSKTHNLHTGKLSKDLININKWLNYDFAVMFFNTPHKSELVTPAIVLYAKNATSGVGNN